jgi:hypothetical protein
VAKPVGQPLLIYSSILDKHVPREVVPERV